MSMTSKIGAGALATVMGGLMALASFSSPSAAESVDGRYTMSPIEGGGFARLDRQTGAMSICSGKEGEWVCKPMPEADAEMKRKVEELESENRALKAQQSLRDKPLAAVPGDTVPPDAPVGDTVPPSPPGDLPIPTERDVDKLFDYVEGMVRKFKERIDRLEKEAQREPGTSL